LEYDLDEKMAVATGKLQVVYDTGSATAEKAILMEEDKLVTLEGKVSITSEGENKAAFTLDKATVNIETSKLDGDNPTGTFSLKRKKP
jgi:lipopolysaccharide assembly outer membrane protein LptD (OstA)